MFLVDAGILKEKNAGFDETSEWPKDADGNFIVDGVTISAPKKDPPKPTDKPRNYTAIILIGIAAIVAAIFYTRK